MSNTLVASQQLATDQALVSPNGRARLVMQADGNLVLYRVDTNVALWDSRTVSKPVTHAIMQADGNFVCYDASGRPYWATGTNGSPGAYITLQDDGNLVLYSLIPFPRALWASNTVQNWDPTATDTGDVSIGGGWHMQTTASMASTGLISGRTRTWDTLGVKGFTGSVIAVLLDASGKAIWPSNPEVTKHQYGVDGFLDPFGNHDRTDVWSNQADTGIVSQAKSLACYHFYDPKNRVLTDIPIVAKTLEEIISDIKAIIAVVNG